MSLYVTESHAQFLFHGGHTHARAHKIIHNLTEGITKSVGGWLDQNILLDFCLKVEWALWNHPATFYLFHVPSRLSLQTSVRFLCFDECFLLEFGALTLNSSGSPDQRCSEHRAGLHLGKKGLYVHTCVCVCEKECVRKLIQRQHWSVWARKRKHKVVCE